jgi:hypothetical protein
VAEGSSWALDYRHLPELIPVDACRLSDFRDDEHHCLRAADAVTEYVEGSSTPRPADEKRPNAILFQKENGAGIRASSPH